MKSYHHGNLKQELIDCACKLCERDGYTKLSIRTLAKESGVSQTAPYRHFETKEALYASVATDGFNKLSKASMLMLIKKLQKNKSLIWQLNILNLVSTMQIPMILCLEQLLVIFLITLNCLSQQIQAMKN